MPPAPPRRLSSPETETPPESSPCPARRRRSGVGAWRRPRPGTDRREGRDKRLFGRTFHCLLLEALTEEVRHLDEEGAAVAAEPGLEQPAHGAEAVAVHVVVVTGVEGRPRVRRPREEELRPGARL